jgi:uncharacterized membrane protein YeaQ/YmgE (transglycosylase-associated protein family)
MAASVAPRAAKAAGSSLFCAEEIPGFNIYSLMVAVIGAIVVLITYHAINGRRAVP